jgi:hypothetical protein
VNYPACEYPPTYPSCKYTRTTFMLWNDETDDLSGSYKIGYWK